MVDHLPISCADKGPALAIMAIKCGVYVKANLPNFALDFGVL